MKTLNWTAAECIPATIGSDDGSLQKSTLWKISNQLCLLFDQLIKKLKTKQFQFQEGQESP